MYRVVGAKRVITSITPTMWDDIVSLQAKAYTDITPESLEVLQSKWLRSPETCFVCYRQNELVSYLLAHAWHCESAPKLDTCLPAMQMPSRYLFLHDLAVSPTCAGEGVGADMVQHLLKHSQRQAFEQIRLVSVQGSVPFWQKMGFSALSTSYVPCQSYGDDATLMARML